VHARGRQAEAGREGTQALLLKWPEIRLVRRVLWRIDLVPKYMLHRLQLAEKVSRTPIVVQAADEAGALTLAMSVSGGGAFELWKDSRMLVRFPFSAVLRASLDG
jgi:hypothetical protein